MWHHDSIALHILLASGPVVGKFVFDCFVGALESPQEREARGEVVSEKYRFCFRFLNLIAANIQRSRLGNGKDNGGGKADSVSAGK